MELPIAAGGAVGRDHDLAGGVDTVEHPDIVPAIARQGLYHDGAADGVEEAGETRQVAQRLLALVDAVLPMKTAIEVLSGNDKRFAILFHYPLVELDDEIGTVSSMERVCEDV